jgi:alkylation response protein AidB-like acyl-CoA dehydrogenase
LIIDACGSREQKANFLAPICRGDARAAVALLEGDAAWNIDDLKMGARDERLSGEKLFVADAASADYLVVVGRDAAAIVRRDSPRLAISSMPAMDVTRKLYAVRFDETPSEPLRDPRGLPRALETATAALVAEMVGGMQRVFELSVDYAKTRKQFGKPIGQFQAVQHQLADSYLETESARSAAYYAAWALQENAPGASVAVSIAKMYASDAARNVGNRAIQVHGGMGFTWENDLHLYYRRFKGSETAFGDGAYHRERIARLIIDQTSASAPAAHELTDDHYARLSPTYSR